MESVVESDFDLGLKGGSAAAWVVGVSRCFLLFCLLPLLGACTGSTPPLVVKPFRMLDVEVDKAKDPMVRGEKQRRLHGAITSAERAERLGAYYTLLWSDPAHAGQGPVEVIFEYQRGATASKVLRLTRKFDSAETSGQTEFSFTGKDYLEKGRVLAWKATLTRGGRVVATEQSRMWE